jgi:hypothetical protein
MEVEGLAVMTGGAIGRDLVLMTVLVRLVVHHMIGTEAGSVLYH